MAETKQDAAKQASTQDAAPKQDAAKQEETKEYKVTAAKNLGASITGGSRIKAGKKGTVTMTAGRYKRLKESGYFE